MPRGKRKAQKPLLITIEADDHNQVIELVDNDVEEIDLVQERDAYKAIIARKYASSLQDNRNPYAKAEIVKSGDRYRLKSAVADCYRTKTEKNRLKSNVLFSPLVKSQHADNLLNGGLISDAIVWPFFQAVASKNENISVLDSMYSGMEDFAERCRNNPNYARLDRDALRSSRRILWPMFADSHWYLMIMHRVKNGEYKLYCVDSLNMDKNTFFDKAADFLQVLYPDKPLANLVTSRNNIEILRQHNLKDCAASVCFWGARMAACKEGLPPKQQGICDYSAYRYDMAVQVAEFAAKQAEAVPKSRTFRRR